MFTMDDLYQIAIKMEKNGESIYNDSANKISQKDFQELLKWMADEEASHIKWFTKQKNVLSLEIDEIQLKEMVPQVLENMMGENTFSLDDINFNEISSLKGLIETFIGFEEDTILFYEMLEVFIEDDDVIKGLETIVSEEKKHVQTLKQMIETLS